MNRGIINFEKHLERPSDLCPKLDFRRDHYKNALKVLSDISSSIEELESIIYAEGYACSKLFIKNRLRDLRKAEKSLSNSFWRYQDKLSRANNRKISILVHQRIAPRKIDLLVSQNAVDDIDLEKLPEVSFGKTKADSYHE